MKVNFPSGSVRIAVALTGIALLLAALALTVGNHLDERQAELHTQELLSQAEREIQGPMQNPVSPSSAEGSTSISEEGQNASAWDSYDVVGILTIPDLGLILPILGEYDDNLLKVAPCVFEGSWENGPKGLVIVGHNYPIHFKSIGDLPIGANMTFQTMDGTEYALSVKEITEIGADEPEKLDGEQWDLTLFTCNADRSKRILVRCSFY